MTERRYNLNLLDIQRKLLERDVSIISGVSFARIFQLSKRYSKTLLSLAVKHHLLTRIKAGIYTLNAKPPMQFEIANVLYAPSYISLETALSYYRIIPGTVYVVRSITTKKTKEYTKFNRTFSYSKIKKNLYFGYKVSLIGGRKILIAEKEKAFLDYIYFVATGKKKLDDRINLSMLDKSKINNILPHFRKVIQGRKLKTFNNLIKKIYDFSSENK